MSLIKIPISAETRAQSHLKGLKMMYSGIVGKTKYIVLYSDIDKYIHIRIHRKDNRAICNYMDMQEIKDLLIGKNKVAVQVFPKSSDMVNNGNTYHLFSWKDIEAPNLKDLYTYAGE